MNWLASLAGSFIGGPLVSIFNGVMGYFTTAKNVEGTEFAAMTASERDQYVAYVKATTELNAAKVANNWWGAHLLVFAFGIPPALHWAAVYITATFPLGIAIDPLHGYYGDSEKQIAMSFFILAPAMPIVSALSARLRK